MWEGSVLEMGLIYTTRSTEQEVLQIPNSGLLTAALRAPTGLQQSVGNKFLQGFLRPLRAASPFPKRVGSTVPRRQLVRLAGTTLEAFVLA